MECIRTNIDIDADVRKDFDNYLDKFIGERLQSGHFIGFNTKAWKKYILIQFLTNRNLSSLHANNSNDHAHRQKISQKKTGKYYGFVQPWW